MNFAAIATIGQMKDPRIINRPVQFCLAQHYTNPKIPEYRAFYKNAVRLGQTVILDNGVYEGELIPFGGLYTIAQDLNPTVMVLPDMMGNPRMTTYLHNSYLDYAIGSGPDFMSVLHYTNIWDLTKAYLEVKTPWVGLPRVLGPLRVEMCQRLNQLGIWRKDLTVHALGMVDGSARELEYLAAAGVFSADSSNPTWRGIDKSADFNVESPVKWIPSQLQELDQCLHSLSPSEPPSLSPTDTQDVPF